MVGMHKARSHFALCSTILLLLGACDRGRAGGSESAAVSEAAPPAAEAAPKPEPTVVDGYTVGRLIADMYDGKVFCYGYNAADSTCTAMEHLESRSAGQILVVHEHYAFVTRNDPNSAGELLADQLTRGSSINPNGVDVRDYQTLTITMEGLCTTKQQSVQDANMTQYKWITKFDEGGEFVDMDPQKVEQQRESKARIRAGEIGETRCSRYVANAADASQLTEYVFIDGIKQPGPGSVIYVAQPGALRMRPS